MSETIVKQIEILCDKINRVEEEIKNKEESIRALCLLTDKKEHNK